MTDVQQLPVKFIDIDRLIGASWNPNKMPEKQFNRLVQSIQEDGFLEPVLVVPIEDPEMRRKYLTPEQDASGEEYWLIVGGHHRVEAARIVGMAALPCVEKEGWTEDDVKFQNVKMNLLRGKIDPVKMTALYDEMSEKYGEELVREQMALLDQAELKRLIIRVRDELPPELQKKIDEAAGEIQTVDDLSRILNELFSKHGDTLSLNYMVFTYGGKTHLWIDQDRDLFKTMESVKSFCYDHRFSLREVLKHLIGEAKPRLEAARDQFTVVGPEEVVRHALEDAMPAEDEG